MFLSLVRFCLLHCFWPFFIPLIQEKQNGVLGITGPSKQPAKASQAFEEPETQINFRTLTKATTPPVTIKNFFKPKTVEPKLEVEERTLADKGETSAENDCVEKDCDFNNIKEELASSKGPTETQSVPVTNVKEVKSVYFKSKEANIHGRPQQKGTSEGPVRCNGITRHLSEPLSKENLKGKNSLKRNSSDALLRTSKRQKQSSILCSFGKGTEKSTVAVKKKEIFCPVCGVKFASEAKNVEINEHIDGCLIE